MIEELMFELLVEYPETEMPAVRKETAGTGHSAFVNSYLKNSIWKEKNDSGRSVLFTYKKAGNESARPAGISLNQDMLAQNIDVLSLSVRSNNCLKRAGIHTIEDLVTKVEDGEDLMKIRNLGRKSADEILFKLEAYRKYIHSGRRTPSPAADFF